MFSIKMIILVITVFATFSSLFLAIASDFLFLVTQPNVDTARQLMKDTGILILSSQSEISNSLMELSEIGDSNIQYSNFLFNRIIAGAILTFVIIWLFYWILKKLPLLHNKAPIWLGIFAVVIVGFLQVFANFVIHGTLVYPYQGFIDVFVYKDALIQHLTYTLPTNQTVGR